MSHDIDTLIDSAFEHDRAKLPKAADAAPTSLLQKASLPVSSVTGGFIASLWLKYALGIIAIGSVTLFFILRSTHTASTVPPHAPGVLQPVLDSPIVSHDSTAAPAPTPPKHRGDQRITSRPVPGNQPPKLMPPIIDSGVQIADSIRSKPRRPR